MEQSVGCCSLHKVNCVLSVSIDNCITDYMIQPEQQHAASPAQLVLHRVACESVAVSTLRALAQRHSTQTRRNRTWEEKKTLDQKNFQPQTWLCGKKINLVLFCRGNMTSIMLGCNSFTCSILGLFFFKYLTYKCASSAEPENIPAWKKSEKNFTNTTH